MTIPQVAMLLVIDVHPDPEQPRRYFDDRSIAELAKSIHENGLMQPICVQTDTVAGGYKLIAGERRWRAFNVLNERSIPAIIRDGDAAFDIAVAQIVENKQREDLTLLDEAQAYKRLLDQYHCSVDILARKIGLHPRRISERLELLNLQPNYQHLLSTGNLTPSQAQEMSRLSSPGQGVLFSSIKSGNCPGYTQLRAVAAAIAERETQGGLFSMEALPVPPTKEERETVRRLERKIEQVSQILALGFDDGELVAVRRVDPGKAATYAEKLRLIQRHLAAMENSLRTAAIQLELVA